MDLDKDNIYLRHQNKEENLTEWFFASDVQKWRQSEDEVKMTSRQSSQIQL